MNHACNCIGRQNGEPLCPCMMRGVQVIDGRYVRVQDLGPAPTPEQRERAREAARLYRDMAAKAGEAPHG